MQSSSGTCVSRRKKLSSSTRGDGIGPLAVSSTSYGAVVRSREAYLLFCLKRAPWGSMLATVPQMVPMNMDQKNCEMTEAARSHEALGRSACVGLGTVGHSQERGYVRAQ